MGCIFGKSAQPVASEKENVRRTKTQERINQVLKMAKGDTDKNGHVLTFEKY
jgi:hypothetical protein